MYVVCIILNTESRPVKCKPNIIVIVTLGVLYEVFSSEFLVIYT